MTTEQTEYSPSYGEVEEWLDANLNYGRIDAAYEVSAIEETMRYHFIEDVDDYLALPTSDYRHADVTITQEQYEDMQAITSEMRAQRAEWAESIAPTVRLAHETLSAQSGRDTVETNDYSIALNPASEELSLYSKDEGTELARFRPQDDSVFSASGLKKLDFDRFTEWQQTIEALSRQLIQPESAHRQPQEKDTRQHSTGVMGAISRNPKMQQRLQQAAQKSAQLKTTSEGQTTSVDKQKSNQQSKPRPPLKPRSQTKKKTRSKDSGIGY